MTTKMFRILLLLGILLVSTAARPAIDLVNDDTDIFMVNPAVSSQRPNVLLLLDNSANWNSSSGGVTKRTNEMSAIYSVLGALTDQFNLGLMMWMESTGNPSDAENSAGYVRFGVRQMSGTVADTTSNKGRLGSLINYIKAAGLAGGSTGNDDQSSSSFVYAMGMYEAYRYFRGQSSSDGTVASARDYTGNTNSRSQPYISGLTDNPLVSSSSNTYRSPITDKCQKNFVIIISNGPDGSAANQVKAYDRLATVYGEVGLTGLSEITPTSAISFPTPSGPALSAVPTSGVWLDEWTRYMANNDCGPGTSTTKRPVYTYVVDVDPATSSAAKSFSALLFNASEGVGKGKYFAVSNNAQALVDALNKIFQEIQAVNSVFASTTLPVSNNFRGTSLNQVYIGVFRPDGNRLPRWWGNLKMYKLGSNLDQLVDASSPAQAVYNAATGFAFPTTKSFWTTTSTFWSFRGPGYEATDAGKESDSPDGDLVEKGAAAQRLREVYPTAADIDTRKVYTCTGDACVANASLSTMPFNNANAGVTAAALKAFASVALMSVTSVGVTATATTASPHNLGLVGASVTGITIDGVSPNNYNGTDLTVTVTGTDTFTYTLTDPPSTSVAQVSATAHRLNIGDKVTVTGATPTGYNVTDATVLAAGYTNDQFDYTMASSETDAATGAVVTATRSFSAAGASISGTAGTSTATVYWPNHGFGSSPAGGVTIASAGTAAFNVTGATISAITTNSFQYTTSVAIPSSSSSTTVRVTAASHGLGSAGQVIADVTIAGSSVAAYNGVFSVTVIDANTFSYTINSVQTTTVTGSITFSVAIPVTGSVVVSNGSGSNRATATGTVAAGHGLGSSGTINVTISGLSDTSGNNSKFSANSPYSATITNSTVFTYAMTCTATGGSANCPSANSSLTATYSASRTVSGSATQIAPVAQVVSEPSGTMTMKARVTTGTITVIQAGNTTGATVGSPAIVDATLRTNIINWIRGVDNKENENNNFDTTTDPDTPILTDVRASIHGDVLHSRPAVVNYGRDGSNDDVFVYYGTNDGMFRAVKGGFATGGGNEAWSFIAPEFFGKLKRLRDNSPAVSGAKPRDYFFDGPVTIYTKDVNSDGKLKVADGDKVYLYMAMRRGGRMIYALDVSDPDDPKLLWKKGCPNQSDDTGCDTGWSKIGQSWSEPKIAYIRASTNPVLIFGAGYEPNVEDFQPCTVTSNSTSSVTGYRNGSLTYYVNGACWSAGVAATTVSRNKGRGVFVVDAFTGSVIWRVGPDADANRQISGMSYAIPADVSIVNRDRDVQTRTGTENVNSGFIDRIYAVDTGANIWRIDLDHSDKSFWAVNKIATLSEDSLANKRKFMFAPRITNDATCGSFDAIIIGSGDREHPFSAAFYPDPSLPPGAQTATNFIDRFYMVKDFNMSLINPQGTTAATKVSDLTLTTATDSELTDLTTDCIGSCSDSAVAALKTSKGWRFNFASGEKAVTSATVQGGLVQFATNQPKGSAGDTSCSSDLGIAREYKVNFCNALSMIDPLALPGTATTRSSVLEGGGFQPSPTPAIVCENGVCKEVTCFGPKCGEPVPLKLDERKRTYWYKKGGS